MIKPKLCYEAHTRGAYAFVSGKHWHEPQPRKALKYYRIKGKDGVYLFTESELNRALDRENNGVTGEIIEENNNTKHA